MIVSFVFSAFFVFSFPRWFNCGPAVFISFVLLILGTCSQLGQEKEGPFPMAPPTLLQSNTPTKQE